MSDKHEDSDSKKAFDSWYAKNKDKRNEARRKKYEKDKSFREAECARARGKYAEDRERNGIPPGRWAGREATSVRQVSRRLLPRMFKIGKKEVFCLPLGALFDEIAVAYTTFLRWERGGVLPPATTCDESKRRWYSQALFDAIVESVKLGRKEGWTTEILKSEIAERVKK